jgi:UDP-2,3-diacylglucosamine hydrolase
MHRLLDDPTVLHLRPALAADPRRCAVPGRHRLHGVPCQVRGAAWQQDFLDRPLAERQAVARGLRDASEQRKRSGAEYADLDADAPVHWLDAARAP